MQLGSAFQRKKCARCRHVIQSDPALADDLWYHRTCLEEGKRALTRTQELTARFGVVSADSHTPVIAKRHSNSKRAPGKRLVETQAPHSVQSGVLQKMWGILQKSLTLRA